MKKQLAFVLVLVTIGLIPSWTQLSGASKLNTELADPNLKYCDKQVKKTLSGLENTCLTCLMPRNMNPKQYNWNLVEVYDWTSGFWPGILWYNYEYTGDESVKEKAMQYTDCMESILNPEHKGDHDIGFQMFCSYGNAYRLTKNADYKQKIFDASEKLAEFYNPTVGTILSWSHMVDEMGWPHNTIMDNMMNLEILFWTAKNGGDKRFYDMAVSHAKVTMENQFREDGSNYHVAIYDTISGKFIKGVTNQGIDDNSMWARGQAWAIYGYTMVYRETLDKTFLRFAEKVTDIYLERLPEDYVPFWDFDDPKIPNVPKDASSAAIVASALLELSQLEDNNEKAKKYLYAATETMKSLSSNKYRSGDDKPSFLLHCTGNYPSGYEIDASINYADYYYIEALIRYKRLSKGLNILANLF